MMNAKPQWRGAMLDISRHFFTVEFIERTISALAVFDYNRLHLHLTDDQGWRIESKRFPLLHEVGSTRPRSQVSHTLAGRRYEEKPHSGFLTQDEIRELVEFGKAHGIEIVPEVNIPGHTGALLAAYPQLGLGTEEPAVLVDWGISRSLISPLPETFEFLRELLAEVSDLFPSEFFHVGGDESLIDNWLADSRVQELMRSESLDSAPELLSHFMSEVEKILSSFGKKMITWDDAFANNPELATDAVVMSWRGEAVAKLALKQGRQVIESPVFPLYFDYSHEVSPREPLAIGGPVSTADVLAFRPLANTLGVQFQLWTEYVKSPEHAEYMMWPRAAAMAFACWGVGDNFEKYFEERKQRLLKIGVNIRSEDPKLRGDQSKLGIGPFHPGYPVADVISELASAASRGVVANNFDAL
jgi:hexosaminidase